jgi:GMP synthase (glutamine-hydrolysing)
MRALAIVHQPDAGPGVFAEEMSLRGVELERWELSRRGAGPPREVSAYDAILSFGGSMHADQEDAHPWLRFEKDFLDAMVDDGTPLLAVCLGAQLLAEAAGGEARRAGRPEIGWHEVELSAEGAADPLLGPLAPRFTALQWHSYEAVPPAAATVLARSPVCVQAYRVGELIWGIQFHAEVTHADLESWIDDARTDEDAVAAGVDAEAVRAESRERIAEWNRLGRELCGRFCDQVRLANRRAR